MLQVKVRITEEEEVVRDRIIAQRSSTDAAIWRNDSVYNRAQINALPFNSPFEVHGECKTCTRSICLSGGIKVKKQQKKAPFQRASQETEPYS